MAWWWNAQARDNAFEERLAEELAAEILPLADEGPEALRKALERWHHRTRIDLTVLDENRRVVACRKPRSPSRPRPKRKSSPTSTQRALTPFSSTSCTNSAAVRAESRALKRATYATATPYARNRSSFARSVDSRGGIPFGHVVSGLLARLARGQQQRRDRKQQKRFRHWTSPCSAST